MKRNALFVVAVIGIAVIFYPGANAADKDSNEDSKDKGIQLALTLSPSTNSFGHSQYDPVSAAQSPVLTLVIINRSPRAITLPADYDGKVLRLWGTSAEQSWPLSLGGRTPKQIKTVRIAPGEQRICFTLPLSEILGHQDSDRDTKGKSNWFWDWTAHPKSPPSPIHRIHNNGLVPTAVFWAEIVIDNQSLRTAPLILSVKSK